MSGDCGHGWGHHSGGASSPCDKCTDEVVNEKIPSYSMRKAIKLWELFTDISVRIEICSDLELAHILRLIEEYKRGPDVLNEPDHFINLMTAFEEYVKAEMSDADEPKEIPF